MSELLWNTMPGQSYHYDTTSMLKRLLQSLYRNCILNLLTKSIFLLLLSAAILSCSYLAMWWAWIPPPTLKSRSSLPCIAPWQFYNTSFLGHNPLRSGCFPRVFVEESEGPSLLQSCFRQVQGEYREKREGSERICSTNIPHSKCVDSPVIRPLGGTVRTQTCFKFGTPACTEVQSWSGFSINRRYLLHCNRAVT